MKKIFLIIFTSFLFLSSSKSFSGEVSVFLDSFCFTPTRIIFNGDITDGDAKKLHSAIKYVQSKYQENTCKRGTLHLELSSNGGSVLEALKLGELIREEELSTSIYVGRKCFSSCVYVFAGGVSRYNFGQIGVHRPYYSQLDANLTTNQIREYRDALNLKIRSYLNKMDISIQLLEDSLGIPPEKIKILSLSELEKYRLIGDDASFDERQTAYLAKFWNMSSAEYRKKSEFSNIECSHLIFSKTPYEHSDCVSAKFSEISTEEAARRRNKSMSVCKGLKDTELYECNRNIKVFGN